MLVDGIADDKRAHVPVLVALHQVKLGVVLAPSDKEIRFTHANVLVPSDQTKYVSGGRRRADHECEFIVRVDSSSDNRLFNNSEPIDQA